jgi:hypothetical protein
MASSKASTTVCAPPTTQPRVDILAWTITAECPYALNPSARKSATSLDLVMMVRLVTSA